MLSRKGLDRLLVKDRWGDLQRGGFHKWQLGDLLDLGMSLGDGEDKSANLQRLHQLQSTFCWVRQRIQQVG